MQKKKLKCNFFWVGGIISYFSRLLAQFQNSILAFFSFFIAVNSKLRKVIPAKKSSFFLNNFPYWCQFHQRFTLAFFVRKFIQSQNVTRKKAFIHKIWAFNIDEIDHWLTEMGTRPIQDCDNKF
jgi:hypothetical protein